MDTGNSNVTPTITIHDAETHPNDVATIVQPAQTPGSIDAGPYVIPDWYKVGWRAAGGLDSPELEGEAKDAAILSTFLKEQYYGDWYHNAGLVLFVSSALPPLFSPGPIILPGCTRYPLYDSISLWLGLDDPSACRLRNILFHFYGSCEEAGP